MACPCYLFLLSAIYSVNVEGEMTPGRFLLIQSRTLTGGEDEVSLVESAQSDPAAFAILYWQYVTPVFRYVYSRVGNVPDAKDLTAQVFSQALEGLSHYRHRGRFAAGLFTIARRRVADHYRGRQDYVSFDESLDSPDRGDNPVDCLVRQESLERLAAPVGQLDEEKQELLRLRFAAGLTYGEMARVLKRSEAAVKMAVRRLLRRLEAEWEEEDV